LQAKAEEDFGKYLSSGDEFVSKKMYSEAIVAYRNALKIHPQDAGSLNKLSESEKSLSKITEERKRTNEEFNQLLSEGERNLSTQKYTEAIENFKNALDRKPGDQLALSKLETARQLANKLNADRVKNEQEFVRLITAGDLSFGKKNFPEAVASYKAAIQLKPADPIAVSRLASAEKLINELRALQAQNEEAFRMLVLNGDKNMSNLQFSEAINNYKRATDINPADQPVQEKLRKAQEKYSQEEEFRQFLTKGDENSAGKRYAEAIDFYSKALAIRSTAELRGKITAARDAMRKINQPSAPVVQKEPFKSNLAESYADQIRSGDENFSRSQYAAARFYYVEALKISPRDSYALKKLESCDQLIRENVTAEKLKAYEELMKKAQTAYQGKNYSSARFYYRSALEILPWEKLPAEKLGEIDKLYSDKLSAADQQLFRENQQKGDQAFQKKDYAVARYFYNKSNEINPDEYNRSKLRQIDDLISGTEKNRREAEYNDLVNRGNEAFNRKNDAQARYYYTKALEMKPGDEYLKEQLKKLTVTK
jgi:tetratricopeptide (TPR) repeat protein